MRPPLPSPPSATSLQPRLHYIHLLEKYNIAAIPTRFGYAVSYHDGIYAPDIDSALRAELAPDIRKFQSILAMLKKLSFLSIAR